MYMAKSNISKLILKILSRKQVVSMETVIEEAEIALGLAYTRSPSSGQAAPTSPIAKRNKAKYAIARSVKNLIDSGLAEELKSDHFEYVRLTPSGRHKLHSLVLDSESALLNTSWDGLWRMILLDLPEERKNEREALRYLLKKAGFVCLKNSVWISMYPFEHLFTNIKKDLGLSTELIILVTDRLDTATEEAFLKMFGK